MARKRNRHIKPISNKVRVRMHRERVRLRNLFSEREEQAFLNSHNIVQDEVNQNEHSSDENIESTLTNKIRDWACVFRISKRAIDSLLAILISSGHDSLPKNHRTLQGTPTNIEINNVGGGQYWYNGLEKCLKRIFSKLDKNINISLNFNIDGLPLYKSSAITFYPILAAIHGTQT